MPNETSDPAILSHAADRAEGSTEVRRQQAVIKTVALQNAALQKAIFNSANFSSIATDAKGVIQILPLQQNEWAHSGSGRCPSS